MTQIRIKTTPAHINNNRQTKTNEEGEIARWNK